MRVHRAWGAMALLPMLAAGCQSYERAPLDLPAHTDAFLARTPAAPEVEAFAASLAPAPGAESNRFDPSDGLTLHETEIVALVFNSQLRLARLRAGVTRATAENAGLWEDPIVGVELTRILESGAQRPWEVFGSIGFTIPISGRLEIEKQRAGVEHAVELARVARAEWEVRMSVRRTWAEWVAATAALEATRAFVTRVDQVLAIVDIMERAGETARTEARLFRVERAATMAEVPLLEARVEQALRELRHLMGLAPGATLDLRPNGLGADELAVASASDLAPESLQRRSLAMVEVIAAYEVAERTLELAIREQFPDLQLVPGYGKQDGQRQFTLGISAPIPVFNGNRRAIAEAAAQRELARAEAESALERLLDATRSAQIRAAAATAQRSVLEREIVPLVDAQYADARQLAQLGEVKTLVLLESLTRQQESKIRLIESRREEAIAAIDLVELAGPLPLPTGDEGAPASLPHQPEASGALHPDAATLPGHASPAAPPSSSAE